MSACLGAASSYTPSGYRGYRTSAICRAPFGLSLTSMLRLPEWNDASFRLLLESLHQKASTATLWNEAETGHLSRFRWYPEFPALGVCLRIASKRTHELNSLFIKCENLRNNLAQTLDSKCNVFQPTNGDMQLEERLYDFELCRLTLFINLRAFVAVHESIVPTLRMENGENTPATNTFRQDISNILHALKLWMVYRLELSWFRRVSFSCSLDRLLHHSLETVLMIPVNSILTATLFLYKGTTQSLCIQQMNAKR